MRVPFVSTGFQMLWNASAAGKQDETLRSLCTRLLGVLFERDSRRAFTAPEDWFIADRCAESLCPMPGKG
jgi:hypothetical protein